ncbi:MAG: transcription antitermination factor NusB [bacterium]|jgi:N utilization substance protein B|nr:transcription antitermination factor NusB [bacterium]
MQKARRRGRELALYALYAFEMTKNPLEQITKEVIETEEKNEGIISFAEELAKITISHSKDLDQLIERWAHNWEFSRIAIIDKLILRMAISEFLYFEDIPPKVSIDEAIEISKKYSTEQSGKFINGILDSVLNDLKNLGQINKTGRGLNDGKS